MIWESEKERKKKKTGANSQLEVQKWQIFFLQYLFSMIIFQCELYILYLLTHTHIGKSIAFIYSFIPHHISFQWFQIFQLKLHVYLYLFKKLFSWLLFRIFALFPFFLSFSLSLFPKEVSNLCFQAGASFLFSQKKAEIFKLNLSLFSISFARPRRTVGL